MLVQERAARERREIVTWKLVYGRVVWWRERERQKCTGRKEIVQHERNPHNNFNSFPCYTIFWYPQRCAPTQMQRRSRLKFSLPCCAQFSFSLKFSLIDFSLSRNPIFDDQQRAFDEEYLMSGTPSSWTCFSPDRSAEKLLDRTGKISSQPKDRVPSGSQKRT